MELLVPILDRVKAIWQLFDLERQPPMLLNRLVYLKQQMAELQRRLDETQRRSDEKDEQIAKLQDIVAVKDDLITDGAAYYLKKDSDTLDGPFCASCFRHSHVMVRIASASHEEGPDGQPLTPAQCLKCRTPFRLECSEKCPDSSPAAATNGAKKKSQKSTRKTSTKTRTRRPKSREKQLRKMTEDSSCSLLQVARVIETEPIRTLMTPGLLTTTPCTPILEAMRIIVTHGITGLPVVDGQMELVGIISEKDLLSTLHDPGIRSCRVGDIMTRDLTTFDADADALDVCKCLANSSFRRLPVVERGKLVGIVSRADLIMFILRNPSVITSGAVRGVNVTSIPPEA